MVRRSDSILQHLNHKMKIFFPTKLVHDYTTFAHVYFRTGSQQQISANLQAIITKRKSQFCQHSSTLFKGKPGGQFKPPSPSAHRGFTGESPAMHLNELSVLLLLSGPALQCCVYHAGSQVLCGSGLYIIEWQLL